MNAGEARQEYTERLLKDLRDSVVEVSEFCRSYSRGQTQEPNGEAAIAHCLQIFDRRRVQDLIREVDVLFETADKQGWTD